jgi:hypothetical protein
MFSIIKSYYLPKSIILDTMKIYYIYNRFSYLQMKNLLNSFKNTHFSLNSILYNRFLLYLFVCISIINMTVYGLMGDIQTPLIFILIGVITAYYNKNMLVILVISLAFSNIIKYGTALSISSEGFSDNSKVNENNQPDVSGNTDVLDVSGNKELIEIEKMKNKIINAIDLLQNNINTANAKLTELQKTVKTKQENFMNQNRNK